MSVNLTHRTRWILATIFLTIGSVLFVGAWTSPFIHFGWLAQVRTWFPFVLALLFVLLYSVSLVLLSRATPQSASSE